MIELRQVESTVVVTLAAGRANALDYPMLEGLSQAIDSALANNPRALIVTGTDTTFCGGLALPSLIDLDRDTMRAFMNVFSGTMRRLLEAPIPTVAAINGGAIAGGCVIAMMCDQRVMVGDGPKGPPRIGLNEVQLGIGLPSIVLEVARQKLTPAAFTEVALGGNLFDGPAARALGLVDEVVAPSVLEQRTMERVRTLTSTGAEAYAQIKRAWTQPLLDVIERTNRVVLETWLDTWFSDEGQERLRATVARLTKKA
jgi:enoyl-CoA hydratase/carnithine racemase